MTTTTTMGPSAAAAETAVQRLVLVVTPPWVVAMLASALAEPRQWPAATVAVSGAVLLVGYLGYLLSPTRPPAVLVVPMAASSVVIAVTGPPGLGLTGAPLVATWLSLTVFAMGALIPGVRAYAAGTATAALVLAAGGAVQLAQGHPVPLSGLLATAVYSLADCYVAAAAMGVLRRTAADTDAARAAHAQAEQEAARVRAGQRELRRVYRLLHDTVVNTLAAVARFPRSAPDVVAARCAADLALLQEPALQPVVDPDQLLDSATRRAALLGLRLDVQVQRRGPLLDEAVATALEGACWEALNNVAKHSGQAAARLAWAWDGRHGRVVVSDRGQGFDPALGWSGGALESVVARCSEAGVVADVVTSHRQGTAVVLTWDAADAPDGRAAAVGTPPPSRDLDLILAETVQYVALVIGGVGALSVLGIPGGWPRWGTLLALAVVAAVGGLAWAIRTGRRDARLPWMAYPVGAFLATALPAVGMSMCAPRGEWTWGQFAGMVLVTAAILLDRRATVVLLTTAAFVAGNVVIVRWIAPSDLACVQGAWSILVVDLGVAVAMWAYGRRVATVWRQGRQEWDLMVSQLRGASEVREAIAVRRQLLGIARAVSEPVLSGLARGELDPRDPQVRTRCARAEETLRALSALPTAEPGSAGEVLAGFIVTAHQRGARVTLTVGPEAVGPGAAPVGLPDLLHELGANLRPDAAVQVTLLRVGDARQVLALVDRPDPRAAGALTAAGWTVTPLEHQILAEAALDTSELVRA